MEDDDIFEKTPECDQYDDHLLEVFNKDFRERMNLPAEVKDDDIFVETPEYDQLAEDRLRRSEEQAKMLNKPVQDNMQQVEEAKKPERNNVKMGPKPPKIYKKGKEAPAYKSQYNDDEIVELYCKWKSYREIARILNIKSPSTVRRRIERIKAEMFKKE